MKDYYYLLGISTTASAREIKHAYHKLSSRLHPDKNEGDPFFEQHFKDISEAYNTLSHRKKRSAYDLAWQSFFESSRAMIVPSPTIDTFAVSSRRIHEGARIEIHWKTSHADQVYISCFDHPVPPRGSKTITFSDVDGHDPSLEINAVQTATAKSVHQRLQLRVGGKQQARIKWQTPLWLKGVQDKILAPLHDSEVGRIVRQDTGRYAVGIGVFAATLFYGLLATDTHLGWWLAGAVLSLVLSVILCGAVISLIRLARGPGEPFKAQLIRNIPLYLIVVCIVRLVAEL